MMIKEINDLHKQGIKEFRGSIIASRGKVHSLDEFPGFVVLVGDELKGLITQLSHPEIPNKPL